VSPRHWEWIRGQKISRPSRVASENAVWDVHCWRIGVAPYYPRASALFVIDGARRCAPRSNESFGGGVPCKGVGITSCATCATICRLTSCRPVTSAMRAAFFYPARATISDAKLKQQASWLEGVNNPDAATRVKL